MPELDSRTATIDVERAMQATIALALRRRYPAVADVAALRAFHTLVEGSSSLDDAVVELISITGGAVWKWSASSTAADNGTSVIAPTDRTNGALPGRWLITSSTSTDGYLTAVRIFEGEDSEEAIMTRLLAVAPSVMVVWRSEEPDKQSQLPGAYYRVWMNFEIWCASRNLRRGNEALTGSSISDEADADPGVLRIVGDVRGVLAGSDLGLPDGIDYCYPGTHRPKIQSLTEGQFVHSLAVRLAATLRFYDAAGESVPAADIAIGLQPQLVKDDGATLQTINPGDPDQVPPPNP